MAREKSGVIMLQAPEVRKPVTRKQASAKIWKGFGIDGEPRHTKAVWTLEDTEALQFGELKL